MNRTLHVAGLFGLIAFATSTSAWAQAAPGADTSMGCRLFPLACPGPVPPPPPPLLGTPEEQAAAPEAPPPVKPHAKHRKARKHTSSAPAQ